MKIRLISLMLLLLITINACKKDGNNIEPFLPDTTCLLTKIIHSYDDVIDTVNIEYNKQRRLVKYAISSSYCLVEYDTEGRISLINLYLDDRIAFTEYSWGSNNLVTISGSKTNDGKIIYEYKTESQLDGGKTVKINQFYYLDGEWMPNTYSLYKWKNGNITSAKRYNMSGEIKYSYSYEYDDKPNSHTSFGYFGILTLGIYTKNNPIKSIITNYGVAAEDLIENIYEYNNKGFPTSKSEWISGKYTGTTIFEYDCKD